MSKDKNPAASFRTLLQVLAGNLIYAFTVHVFLLPGKLVTGGVTGISIALAEVSKMQVSTLVLIMNIGMLLLGLIFIGKKFVLSTVLSSFAYPIFLSMFNYLLPNISLTDDIFLNSVFSGLGVGICLGVVIRAGASTGGMDIPPIIFNKYFGLPVSTGLYLCDGITLLVQALLFPPRSILYGIFMMGVYSVVMDRILVSGSSRTEIMVISEKSDEIRQAILDKMDRGVTLLEAKTGYTGKKIDVVMSVVSRRELPGIQRLILQIDPLCFMTVTRINEVRGRGFTLSKDYR